MTNSEAIEVLKANYPDTCYSSLREAVDVAINALSAQPRKGKWYYSTDTFEYTYALCSVCKWDSGELLEYAENQFKYCPHCGADMRGDRNELRS